MTREPTQPPFADHAASPVPAVALDGDLVTHVNEAAGLLFDCSPEVLLDHGLRARLFTEDLPAFDDAVAAARNQGVSRVTVRSAGEPPRRVFSLHLSEQGDVVIAVFGDITERRRLESTVRELAEVIVTIDSDLIITWTPASSAAALGLVPNELEGVSVLELIHPDDHDLVRRSYQQARLQPGTKGSIRVRISHPREPDVFFQVAVDFVYLPDDDVIGQVLVALHTGIDPRLDATPTSAATDRNVVETATVMPQGMLLVDHDGNVLQRNSRVRQLLGSIVDRQDGRAWLEQVASADRERARLLVEAAASGERRPSELVDFERDGTVLALRVDVVPFEQHAQASSYVVHFLDVTAETEQQQRRVEYEKLAALGEMSAGVAHELNNPLNFVVNFAQSVRDDASELRIRLATVDAIPDDEARMLTRQVDEIVAAGDRIAHHGRRASSIVRRMLAQIAGESDLSWVDLNDVVTDAIDRAREQASFRGRPVDAAVSFAPTTELDPIYANGDDLTRAISNIVANALYAVTERRHEDSRFSPAVAVTVSDLGAEVEVVVWDNGTGIDPAILSEVFNPLFTTKGPSEGIGLGLPQCHAAVAALAGDMEIQSDVGAFTEVTIRLPKPAATEATTPS